MLIITAPSPQYRYGFGMVVETVFLRYSRGNMGRFKEYYCTNLETLFIKQSSVALLSRYISLSFKEEAINFDTLPIKKGDVMRNMNLY